MSITNFQLTGATSSTASFSWTPPPNYGAFGDEYEYTLDSGTTWTFLASWNQSSGTVSGLTAGDHTISIRMTRLGGGTPLGTAGPLDFSISSAPTGLTATAGDTQLTISWTDPSISTITSYQYRLNPVTSSPILPTMEKYTKGTIDHSDSTTTLTDFRDRCVATNQDNTFTPPSTITSNIAEPSEDNYIIRQRFLIRTNDTWNRFTMTMPNGNDDAVFLFILQCNPWGENDGTEISKVVINGYSPFGTSATANSSAVAAADWGTAQNGYYYALLEAYIVERTGGQIHDWQLGYRDSSNNTVAVKFVNTSSGFVDLDPGDWTTITGSSATTTSHTITGLTNDQDYSVAIRSVSSGSNSDATSAVYATPLSGASVPATPTGLTATAGDTQVVLSWTNPSDTSITSYQYQIDTGSWTTITGSSSTTTSYTATGLTNNTSYKFGIRAVNSTGNSTAATVTATPIPPVPAVPSGLTATAGDTQITLAWDNPSNSTITSYQYRIGTSGTWTTITGSSATTTSYIVTGLTNGTAATIYLRAVNSTGNGLAGNATATPMAALNPPSTPTGLTGTPSNNQIALSWTDPSNSTINGYQYRLGTLGSWTTITGSSSTTTSYTVTGLTNDTEYTIYLRAVNADGYSPAASVTATPYDPTPSAPISLTGTPGNGEISLTWTDPSDSTITSYQYQVDTGAWTTISGSSATTTSYTVTGLTNGISYTVRLRSVNSFGSSTAVSVSSIPQFTSGSSLLAPIILDQDATVGTAFNFSVPSATGGTSPVSKSLSDLPSGLSYSSSTITGTPNVPGSYPMVVTYTDSAATKAVVISSFDINVLTVIFQPSGNNFPSSATVNAERCKYSLYICGLSINSYSLFFLSSTLYQ